jgi:hypothetical protein
MIADYHHYVIDNLKILKNILFFPITIFNRMTEHKIRRILTLINIKQAVAEI